MHKRLSLVFGALLFLVLPLNAVAQGFYRGDPRIIRPISDTAPRGHMHTNYLYINPAFYPPGGLDPHANEVPFLPQVAINPPYTPANIRLAYNIPNSGGGQAIAIVDAYDLSTSLADFNQFASTYGLPQETSSDPLSSSNKVFQVVYSAGTKPDDSISHAWNAEIALDIEWAHAMAPQAKIYLVEAPNNGGSLYSAVQTASALPGVKEVSMSWGGGEFSGELSYDSTYFTQKGVVYFCATGDGGTQQYPGESPNIIAVGGTSLSITTDGYSSETGWSGTGGGPSAYEPLPIFQDAVISSGNRGNPDVSAVGDPNTGVAVYSASFGGNGWLQTGGTSLACPLIAGITNNREAASNSFAQSSQDEEARIYANLMGGYLHDVTSGSNTGYSATTGYDFVTGVGTPNSLLAPWPSIRGNVPGTGVGFGRGATNAGRWQYKTGGAIDACPAIGPTNLIYFSSSDKKLYAVDSSGVLQWTWTNSGALSSPLLGPDGSIYVVAGGSLVSINSSAQTLNWSKSGYAAGTSVALGTTNILYAFSATGNVVALNPSNGSTSWSTSSGGTPTGAPVIGADGTIYVTTTTALESFSAAGTQNWSYTLPSSTAGTPCVGPQFVYVGTSGGKLVAVNTSGGLAWSTTISTAINGAAAYYEGTVYAEGADGTVHSFSGASGAPGWASSTSSSIGATNGSPVVSSDGTVYVGLTDGNVYALNGSTGAQLWKFNTGGAVNGLVAIGGDGIIYVGNDNDYLSAIGASFYASLLLGPATMYGGQTTTASLNLAKTLTDALTFSLSSNNVNAVVPQTLVVSAGSTLAKFNVTSKQVTSQQTGIISATYEGATITKTLTLNPYFTSLGVAPANEPGGTTATGTINLGFAAPTGGVTVQLSSSGPCGVPTSVVVPATKTSATFPVTTTAVSVNTHAFVYAKSGVFTANTYFYVLAPSILSVTPAPQNVVEGNTTTMTVTLSGPAPSGGAIVTLTPSGPCSIQANVTVLAGKTSAQFTATATTVSATTLALITASYGASSKQGHFYVLK
jgi:outer membrane protein assembly factor BamB